MSCNLLVGLGGVGRGVFVVGNVHLDLLIVRSDWVLRHECGEVIVFQERATVERREVRSKVWGSTWRSGPYECFMYPFDKLQDEEGSSQVFNRCRFSPYDDNSDKVRVRLTGPPACALPFSRIFGLLAYAGHLLDLDALGRISIMAWGQGPHEGLSAQGWELAELRGRRSAKPRCATVNSTELYYPL